MISHLIYFARKQGVIENEGIEKGILIITEPSLYLIT